MTGLSLRQTSDDEFEKEEEWGFDDIQDAEMVEEKPKKKNTRKKTKK